MNDRRFPLLDELRDRITTYLSKNHVCVISANGALGAWAVVAQYENQGLELDCYVPRWSDVIYYLEQDPQIIVIVWDAQFRHVRWLQLRGIAQLRDSLDESQGAPHDDRFVTVHITPVRVDLIDESLAWGARQTWEI